MAGIAALIKRSSSDPRERLELGQQLIAQLQITKLSNDSTLLHDFCDLVVQWLTGSNFKVALLAVEIVDVAIEVSGDVLCSYIVDRMNVLIERLGDSKQSVREATIQLITALASNVYCNTHVVYEKIFQGLIHRQWLVRVGVLQAIRCLLEQNKQQLEVQIQQSVPTLCELMADSNGDVREAAANTLVNVFWQFGQGVAQEIRKKRLIPDAKLQMLMARYNMVQQNGGIVSSLPSTSQRVARPLRRPQIPQKPSNLYHYGRVMASQRCPALEEQENGAAGVPFWQRASSVPANKRPVEISARYTGSAGSVNDEAFQKAFLEVPTCDIFSAKQLKEKIAEQCAILQNVNNDWSKRMNALKLLRSVVLCGGLDYSDFTEELRDMQLALLNSVKDLRSQVCREGCVTIAFYCERLDVRMLGIVDGLMPTLISLLQNSAKVMATSANVALKYVVRYIRCPKLLPHFQAAVLSKSRDIRRNVAVLLMMVLTVWDSKIIEKYMSIFTDCVKGFLNDPDPEARNTGRDMFMQLSPDCKQQLYKSLDPSKQRALSGYLSQSSSSQSIVSERDNITHRGPAHTLHRASPSYYSGRSTSDIDQGAARRATSRARFPGKWSVPLQQVNGNAALSSMRTLKPQRSDSQKNVSVASVRRAAVPTTNYIRSQPGSRSTSPSSRAAPTRLPPRIGLSTNNKMRSQIEDLPDHATDSNESVRFDAVELTTALSSCSSSSLAERKDGLKALHNILSNAKEINKHDVKKISERLSVLIGESSYKLLQPLSDVVISFVRRYNHELNDWLHTLVPKLVIKQSNDMLPSNQEKFLSMLDAIRQSFDPEKQLLAICKFVQDPVRNNVTYKAKQGLLDYMVKLLESMDVWKSMNQSEVRQAINKIFQWTSDPKYSGLICLSEKIVCDMFNLNASSFTSMIATYPNDLKDRLQEIVRKNLSSRDRNGNMSSSTSAHAGILETTAQITELVDRLTISSPARGLPKYQSTPRRPSNENIAHHWFAREESIGSLSGYVLDSQNFADDLVMQEEVICKIGEELSLHNQRNAERMRAMAVLSHITRDNLFALWEKHFKMIFLLLIETLKDNDADIRRMALKLLKEICYSQASRFNHFAEMALIRVLDACTDEAKFVVTAAEDCGNVLATHVSSAICRRVLLAVIKSDVDEAKIHIAIKMLTKVIESLCVDELISIIDEITPPIIATYNYENSSIRKESVICLVAMISIVGEEIMAPYISKLNKGKQKLIDVYLQRMKKPTPAA